MDTYITWLVKLVLAHLLTDFVLQPGHWIESRNRRHFRSPHLYLHGLVTAAVAILLTGFRYWPTALAILLTHTAIDGWKSYRRQEIRYFLIDQGLHLAVIFGCWYFTFLHPADIAAAWQELNTRKTMVLVTAFVFVTWPAGIIIGQFTKNWRDRITDGETLGNAGKWIGIIERIIILILVLNHQYDAIGLLIAAKSLLRFSEANRPEIKTEYLLIGTLISIGLALLTGLIAIKLMVIEV